MPAVFGLGVLLDLDADWSVHAAESILPYHNNKQLRTIEDNRLQNYLRMIELQGAALQHNLAA